MHTPAVSTDDLETEAAYTDRFTTFGYVAEAMGNVAADGIEVLVIEVTGEILIELLHRQQRLDGKQILAQFQDAGIVVEIMLILDLANDLLQYILDGDQARNGAIFIHDDRHMVAAGAKLAQQDIQALALGHEYR